MLENKDPDKDSEIGRLLSALFSEHYNSLVDLACCLGHSQDLAEDVVQETFVTVLCDPVKLLTSENKLSCLTDVLEDRVDCARRRASDALRLQRQLEQYHSEVCMDELKLTTLYGGASTRKTWNCWSLFMTKDGTMRSWQRNLGSVRSSAGHASGLQRRNSVPS